jgi:two-component system, sensor histidine kinase
MSELLIRESTGKALKHSQTVRNAGMRLLRIINDILDLSRMEAGALLMSRSEFSPRTLVADVCELLSDQATKKSVELTATFAPTVPELAKSDAGRIQQVLSNLADNAIKFTERGSVHIVVTSRPLTAASGIARILIRWEVRDSGTGIPADAQNRLFRPFSQLDESATRKFGGTGLGLAISRQLVEALSGSIGLESTLGKGSSFWFEIPVDLVSQAEAAAATPHRLVGDRSGRVLIVEDNPINRELAAEIVQAAGCTVDTAADGEQALARIAEGAFDLVLMDWHMPIMDGISATRRLRIMEEAQGRTRLPVVALTASVLPGDREACAAAGMDDFVAKPFSYEELIALLDRWLPKET